MHVSEIFSFLSEIEIKASFNVIEMLLYEEIKNTTNSKKEKINEYAFNKCAVINKNFDLKDFNILEVIANKDFLDFINSDEFKEYSNLLKKYCSKFSKF